MTVEEATPEQVAAYTPIYTAWLRRVENDSPENLQVIASAGT